MIPFWKLTPGGNPTILLRSEDVPPQHRAAAARAVMSPLHIGAEQAGYIRLSGSPRLDMMGGEFCLNATRAFALLLARAGLLRQENGALAGEVEVSGVSDTVAVRVLEADKSAPCGSLPFAEACLRFRQLPVPEPCGDLFLVRVPGIAHIIQAGAFPREETLAALCAEQRAQCGVEQEEAAGHVWLGSARETAGDCAFSITPVVWVRDTDTLCRETACGSGTLAAALFEHARSGATRFSIVQPSGCALSVRMERRGTAWEVWVGGPVRLTACGETDLSGFL